MFLNVREFLELVDSKLQFALLFVDFSWATTPPMDSGAGRHFVDVECTAVPTLRQRALGSRRRQCGRNTLPFPVKRARAQAAVCGGLLACEQVEWVAGERSAELCGDRGSDRVDVFVAQCSHWKEARFFHAVRSGFTGE